MFNEEELEEIFGGDFMGEMDFSYDPPEQTGVYLIVQLDRYEEFLEDDEAFRLEGLVEVFVKRDDQGRLYAAGEDVRIEEDGFEEYVWAKKSELN